MSLQRAIVIILMCFNEINGGNLTLRAQNNNINKGKLPMILGLLLPHTIHTSVIILFIKIIQTVVLGWVFFFYTFLIFFVDSILLY